MKGEPRCRGWLASGVAAYCDAARAQELVEFASDGLRAFLSKPESRRDDWIPIDWTIEALTLADRIVGNGDGSLAWPIGKFVAGREVGPVKALAIRALPASMIISLAPGLWVTHYRNAGRVVVRSTGETSLVIKFVDVPYKVRVFCLATGGWIEGFLSLGPRRDIVVRQTACACDGAPGCEFTASWSD